MSMPFRVELTVSILCGLKLTLSIHRLSFICPGDLSASHRVVWMIQMTRNEIDQWLQELWNSNDAGPFSLINSQFPEEIEAIDNFRAMNTLSLKRLRMPNFARPQSLRLKRLKSYTELFIAWLGIRFNLNSRIKLELLWIALDRFEVASLSFNEIIAMFGMLSVLAACVGALQKMCRPVMWTRR